MLVKYTNIVVEQLDTGSSLVRAVTSDRVGGLLAAH